MIRGMKALSLSATTAGPVMEIEIILMVVGNTLHMEILCVGKHQTRESLTGPSVPYEKVIASKSQVSNNRPRSNTRGGLVSPQACAGPSTMSGLVEE
jgi:hypothetical protein